MNKDKHKQLVKIDNLRKQLIKTGMKNGLNSPATIKLSQELDKLLFLFIKEKKTC